MIEVKEIATCPICKKTIIGKQKYRQHVIDEVQDLIQKLNNIQDDLKYFNLKTVLRYHPMGRYYYFDLEGKTDEDVFIRGLNYSDMSEGEIEHQVRLYKAKHKE